MNCYWKRDEFQFAGKIHHSVVVWTDEEFPWHRERHLFYERPTDEECIRVCEKFAREMRELSCA